jgi:hypothetical protein
VKVYVPRAPTSSYSCSRSSVAKLLPFWVASYLRIKYKTYWKRRRGGGRWEHSLPYQPTVGIVCAYVVVVDSIDLLRDQPGDTAGDKRIVNNTATDSDRKIYIKFVYINSSNY